MASEDRLSARPVDDPDPSGAAADPLLRDGSGYAFFQAMRLLRLRFGSDQALRQNVRVRPALSLAFPETDIESISVDESGRYHIEANFFGLYGVTSPLPTFYTEDLIDEAMDGRSVMRDFLDIIHAALYPVLFRAWEKYRLWLAVSEHQDTERLQQLYALVGMRGACDVLGLAPVLLPYAGNLGWKPRSALGLQSLLAGLFGTSHVTVITCVRRHVAIPAPDRCLLGRQATVIGENAVLGMQVADEAGNLQIQFEAMSVETFRHLLPGAPGQDLLARVVQQYLEAPLRCEASLRLDSAQVRGARFARHWSRLGLDTWLGDSTGACRSLPGWRRSWPDAIRFTLPRVTPDQGTAPLHAGYRASCPPGLMDMEIAHDAG